MGSADSLPKVRTVEPCSLYTGVGASAILLLLAGCADLKLVHVPAGQSAIPARSRTSVVPGSVPAPNLPMEAGTTPGAPASPNNLPVPAGVPAQPIVNLPVGSPQPPIGNAQVAVPQEPGTLPNPDPLNLPPPMPEPKVAPAPAPSPVNGAVKVKDGKKNGATTKPPAPQPPIAPAPPEPTVNPASAIPTIQPAPAPSPGIPTENVAAAFTTGTLAMQSGKNAEAIEMFEKVVRLDPYYADAWTNLAILYEKSGNLEKSKAAFRKARESIGR